MLTLMLQKRLDESNIVIMHDNARLLCIPLHGRWIEFRPADAVGSDGAKIADGVNLVEVTSARDSSDHGRRRGHFGESNCLGWQYKPYSCETALKSWSCQAHSQDAGAGVFGWCLQGCPQRRDESALVELEQ